MTDDLSRSSHPIRPMARPRRRAGRFVLFLLIALLPFVVLKVLRKTPSQVERPAPPLPTSDASWRARPGQVQAFSDSLASRLIRSLTDLGVSPEGIRRARSRQEGLHAETSAQVPGDLPLAVCNLEVVRQAEQIGGAVLSAVEARDGLSLAMQVGLGGTVTDYIVLTADPNLSRPAGAVALIVCEMREQDGETLNGFCDLDQMITLALRPDPEAGRRVAARAQAGGHGVMIQLPMEAENGKWGTVLRQAMDRVPGATGVINDPAEGRVTENERAMGALLSEVRRRGLFFVDSRASASSVAYRTALRMGVRAGEGVLRLDEEEGVEVIREALGRLADLSAA
ncbi:divergent polysaccharide deacetylase family protein, partial [bacterium]|nr:divergent polysaccharide deacetylase family protein [bacterium]